ncbi:unnamed protein product [Mytilus edulis]|uniref:Uncharacterized protein n=1 Tax=Mytilus edulis TaxID=6550 RepID=A0A8S3PX00_MYTED|nr:unnamed protein product [Mytilus edulis]
MRNNLNIEIQNNELTLNETLEIIHDSNIELQSSYRELADLDQTVNKSCKESPKNSVLQSSRSYLNTPQLSPQSNNNISTIRNGQDENLVNSILDFNDCKVARLSLSPQKHEDGDEEEGQQKEKDHFFRSKPNFKGKRIEDVEPNEDVNMYINIASYNCKNVLNSAGCIDTLNTMAHVICLQEHWLFNFEQNLLGKSIQGINYKIRSVDDNNPISPIQKPRGYGGTAVVWSNKIDHIVDDTIQDGV